MLDRIGTKKITKCFDGKDHETTLTEYIIRLTGNTYHNISLIHEETAFKWDDEEKAWFANVEAESELNRLVKKFNNTGIQVAIKPVYRITDLATNPIGY